MPASAGRFQPFRRVALIGLGLIGSSLARGLRQAGLAESIVGCARTARTRKLARQLDLVEQTYRRPAQAARDADLVVLGTPIGAYAEIAAAIGPVLKPGAIVTDVGSVKRAVIVDVAPHLADGVHLVPGHPVAGTEHSGPEAGFAELFQDRWCVLTPAPETPRPAVDRVAEMWRRLGMRVELMDADHHDRVLAITSHLPHLIAYTIVGTVFDLEHELRGESLARGEGIDRGEVIKYSAGGFRDFTRIAGSDPTMWRDVFLNNRDAVLEMLGRFTEDLLALQRAIRWGEGDVLYELFARTREIRRGVIEAGQAGTFIPLESQAGRGAEPAAGRRRRTPGRRPPHSRPTRDRRGRS
jgi:cyclohexadieny/prephenate dehydrogenase